MAYGDVDVNMDMSMSMAMAMDMAMAMAKLMPTPPLADRGAILQQLRAGMTARLAQRQVLPG